MGNFNASYRGLGELLVSPEMQAAMGELAKRGKAAAEALSPVGGEGDRHRGEYRAAWDVEVGVREEATRRAYGRITNSKDYAASVEFGNGRMQGQYVLTRALDMMRE
jgi:Bacteriophage HK97-gp10, putative tail-component